MSEVVLDASAVLALINEEPGGETVDALLDHATISAVNWSEVIAVLVDAGFAVERASTRIAALGLAVIAFDQPQALAAGALRAVTRSAGLSFGDRACLGLAQARKAPAVTADRRWATLKLSAKVQLIR
jgi:PIN domain nuclease of toxin-antitoxin system